MYVCGQFNFSKKSPTVAKFGMYLRNYKPTQKEMFGFVHSTDFTIESYRVNWNTYAYTVYVEFSVSSVETELGSYTLLFKLQLEKATIAFCTILNSRKYEVQWPRTVFCISHRIKCVFAYISNPNAKKHSNNT
jgi:hypothetical protein